MTSECSCHLDTRLDANLFRSLGDPTRLVILSRLAHCCGDAPTVGEIAADLPVDLSVVSRHLAALREAGVLDAERFGRTVRYRVRSGALAGLLRELADAIDACEQGCCGCASLRSEPLQITTR